MDVLIAKIKQYKMIVGLAVLLILAVAVPITLMQVSKFQQGRSNASASPVSLYFKARGNVAVGDTLSFDLRMDGGANNVSGVDTAITYDSTLLTLVSFTPSSLFTTVVNDTATTGNIHYVGVNLGTDTITGYHEGVAVLKFTAKAPGSAAIGFGNIQLTGIGESSYLPLDNANIKGATFIIGGSAQPTPTPDPNLDQSLTPPTNLLPQGTLGAGATALSWHASPKASGGYYVRVNDETDMSNNVVGSEWSDDCVNQKVNDTNLPTTGGVCRIVTQTSYPAYNFQSGHAYHWWVQTRDSAGKYGPPAEAHVTATAPSNTSFSLDVSLPGIGTNSAQGENNRPSLTRDLSVSLFDTNGVATTPQITTLAYSNKTGLYSGTVQMDGIAPGTYNMKIKLDNTLQKLVPGIFNLLPGANPVSKFPPFKLIPGDIVTDNIIDVKDYSAFLDCFRGTAACTDTQKQLADFNDDNVVDAKDLNILLNSLSTRYGD